MPAMPSRLTPDCTAGEAVRTTETVLPPCDVVSFDARRVCAYHTLMASTVVRSTYALDEETVRRLDNLARHWNVSKSEALRRAIRTADAMAGSPDDRLKALDELQASIRLTRSRAQTWVRELREDRRRSSTRRLAKR
jgi:hypothetical protein